MDESMTPEDIAVEQQQCREAGNEEGAWYSTEELTEKLRWNQKRVLSMLKEYKKQGRMKTGKRPRMNLNDVPVLTPVYQILPAAPAKRSKTR